MNEIAWLLVALFIGCLIGNGAGHDTIARECERLGSFYVGEKTFACEVKP